MIRNRPLSAAEQTVSQHNYMMYCTINGMSYMCLGETVLILFAVQLQCSNTIVAILGGMIYFGFLLLPLGKWMTARVGAVRSQADFWIMRNAAALVVAMAAPLSAFGLRGIATVFLLTGAFLFYGFRAAGVVMSQPLMGEICEKSRVGRLISRSWVAFYGSGAAALVVISLLLKIHSSVWMLFFIILCGSVLGVTSSGFLRKIDETGDIRKYAARPVLKQILSLFQIPVIRHQMTAAMICNLAIILTGPISMLALKRGYLVSDTRALLYSLVQFGACILESWLLSKVADRFGARNMAIFGYGGFFVISLCWILAPVNFCWYFLLIPFLFVPFGTIVMTNSFQQYFIKTVQKSDQVAASMLISIATGVVSGLLGMAASSGLLKLAAHVNGADAPLMLYRIYFAFVLILLPAMGVFVRHLDKDI